jgi:putative FmdB family regulatory protein
MPVYTYRCSSCGTSFERVESMSRHGSEQPICPHCHGNDVEQRFTSVSVKTAKKS